MASKFTPAQIKMLETRLDKDRVSKREGRGGKSFDYLESWDVEDRANQIFGYDGWSSEVLELIETWSGERNGKPALSFRARVRVTVYADDREVIKEDWGYGDGSGRDLGEASELAVKESVSDAEKRAFKKFGWQFGLALYDKSQANVERGADREIERIQDEARETQVAVNESRDEPEREETIAEPKQTAAPPPKADKPAPRSRQTTAKADPGAPKVRKFPLPRWEGNETDADIKDIWRKWTQQIAAAIKSAPDEKNAREMLAANAEGITAASKTGDVDVMKWALDQIGKRWPQEEAPEETEIDEALEIPPPEVHTLENWDDWMDLLKAAIDACPDVASARAVLAANAHHCKQGSPTAGMDIELWAESQIDKAFSRTQKAR